MRAALKLMRHEGYAFDVNVFDREQVCTDPNDLWSANCAIPNLLFDDLREFERRVPGLKVRHASFSECLTFLNSGGVIAKTASIPLPRPVLQLVKQVDDLLASRAHQVFALQRQIVLEKR